MNRALAELPRRTAVALAGGLLLGVACTRADDGGDDPSAVVEAELEFARAAASLGTRDAFLAYVADEGVIFRPRAVRAVEYLRSQPATHGLLAWRPALAGIARAGDLGFTTGPWDYRQETGGEPLAHGQYFTFWKKQADGSWKFVIDHGVRTPAPAVGPGAPQRLARPPGAARPTADTSRLADRESLIGADRAFAALWAADGAEAALAANVSPEVRALRSGLAPLVGRSALEAEAVARPGTLRWNPLGGDLSRSGDLGYTYGDYEFTAAGATTAGELGTYLRAWQRFPDGGWRVVVDLLSPLPPEPGG
jgi:ketosteroid isomerase-like protein